MLRRVLLIVLLLLGISSLFTEGRKPDSWPPGEWPHDGYSNYCWGPTCGPEDP